jgi:branched-chain amino acid transport system ATP-binding protein
LILESRELVAGYGKLPVLHSISVALPEGEAVAIVGPNGAGKSTLLKTLARQLPVMEGDVLFRGQSYANKDTNWAANHGIAFVPQGQSVFPSLTVLENLRIGAWLHSSPDQAVKEAMSRFPILKERAGQVAGSLSGGERQILAISCALLMRPSVLLLDEPTSGLAPKAARLIIDWISEIVEQGMSVIWVVEQLPELVLERSQSAYMLEAGDVKFEGKAKALLREGELEKLFLERG